MPESARLLPDPSARLENALRRLHAERMRGLPFINRSLQVEAIDFAPWKQYWLGVMLTPWSMNLMLTPYDATGWRPLPQGEKRRYRFPAGDFDFISACDADIGDHFVCSLFSPVLEFADHETARQTARLARAALLDAANAIVPEQPATKPEPAGPLAQLEASLAAPVSRRDLLHGRLSPDGDGSRG